MSHQKLLSIAEISRSLNLPESTLHYWKKRFEKYLPSTGESRNKRFKHEATNIFSQISTLLKSGYTASEVETELSIKYPVNPDVTEQITDASPCQANSPQIPLNAIAQVASIIGKEIANSLNTPSINEHLPKELTDELKCTNELLSAQKQHIETLSNSNQEMEKKLNIMEAELIRLRKDRRELEAYLLDKLKAVTK